jgi:hypothetical protein
MNITIYNSLTGAIRLSGAVPEAQDVESMLQPGEIARLHAVSDPERQYVEIESGEIMDKAPMTYVINGTTISNLPNPCKVLWEGGAFDVTDGEVELESDLAGEYPVLLMSTKYLPATVKVVIA